MRETWDEHLAWCKARALEYLDAGDLGQAVASMMSDLTKWNGGARKVDLNLGMIGILLARNQDAEGVRLWIEVFQ